MKIAIACDHAALDMKNDLVAHLKNQKQYIINDLGTFDKNSVDYPDYAEKVAYAVANHEADFGILICGTGIGMSIAANRFPEVRAAVCYEKLTTQLARQHNDANILALGARIISNYKARILTDIFLTTDFLGAQHTARVAKLNRNEN